MKRTTLLTILTFAMALTSATPAKACLPYTPWLDPFAWLGFYGCGYGYGYGYGGCCGGYGGYQAPVYSSYAPQAPIMNYPVAPAPAAGCNCTSALPQQQAMTAVRVPVTTYRAVTQYVPQTTYRTQYQPTTAYAAPIAGGVTYPSTAYAAPTYPSTTYYGGAPSTAQSYYDGTIGVQPSSVYPSTPIVTPGIQTTPGVVNPLPTGDIAGDHEYPSQSAVVPNVRYGVNPIRPASYGVTPQPARTFSAAVR